MSTKEKKQETNKFWERLGIPVCSLREAREVVDLCFTTQQVPCLIGEAGIGKSQLGKQIAQDKDWNAVFLYLAHLEREDIGGIPYPSGNGHMSYEFLCEKSIKSIIDSDKPTMLMLDEWNRGEKSVMNAAFTLMEDRRFGSYRLPDHVHIMAAMNPSEANYLVNEAEKDPAFRRRLVMMAVQANIAAFLEHAKGRGDFHPLVVSYLTAQPQSLNDTGSRDAGKVYANPAAWEKISEGLKQLEAAGTDISKSDRLLNVWGSGIVGMGVMSQFLDFLKENASVINPHDILRNYRKYARDRVLKLTKTGRNDAFSEISESLAVAVVSGREDADIKDRLNQVAANISEYLNDLPREAIMAFLTKLGKHAQDVGEEGVKFQLELSDELSQNKAYNEAVDRITDAHEKVENEQGKKKR